jgi:hypothetical protein
MLMFTKQFFTMNIMVFNNGYKIEFKSSAMHHTRNGIA